jgi:hypothetical protein
MTVLRRFVNRLAWKIVRATQAPAHPRPRCLCGTRHREGTVCRVAAKHARLTIGTPYVLSLGRRRRLRAPTAEELAQVAHLPSAFFPASR